MSRDKATGIDGIPARFLRDGATEILKPITHIINISISSGKVPSEFKIVRVVPLHKKKSKTDTGNYRPVSILSCLSKVFERIIYDQLSKYLKSKNLIYDLQSGFRPSFSTDTTLTYLTDYIRKQMDRGSLTPAGTVRTMYVHCTYIVPTVRTMYVHCTYSARWDWYGHARPAKSF